MRVWGRETQSDGTRKWVAYGDNYDGGTDLAYFIWLQQALLLHVGESPFNTSWGGWSLSGLARAVYPDIYMTQTQQRMAPYFSSLSIKRVSSATENTVSYDVAATMLNGTAENMVITQANTQAGAA